MTTAVKKTALTTMQWARRSKLRRPILHTLVWTHNTSYHLISFFASHAGLHPKHKILNYHKFFTSNVDAADDVLDIGSGNGAVAHNVAKKANQVVGIDIRASNVHKAKQAYQRSNLSFITGDATSHTFEQPFSVIILSNVLEHIEHRVEFLQKLVPITSRILIRVPLLTRDWVSVYKKQEGFEYRLDDTHFTEYTESQFRQEIADAGLHIDHLHTAFGELYAAITTSRK